jgi:hypothetical protein
MYRRIYSYRDRYVNAYMYQLSYPIGTIPQLSKINALRCPNRLIPKLSLIST